MKRLPFIPFRLEVARGISRHFLGFGEMMEKMFPQLDFYLQQSQMSFEKREWLGLSFFVSLVYSSVLFVALTLLMFTLRGILPLAIGVGFAGALAIGTAIFFYFSFYPRLVVKKKVRDIESNIPYVLNHLLVEVRSGVTMFNAMSSLIAGKYGRLSDEFAKVVTEINTGKSEADALENMAVNNPSLYLRRVIWQMVNALKSGADIGMTLKEIVDNVTSEQKTSIKKYGSELNPLSLFYMMLVVIFPTLGIVFMLVMFSFIGVAFSMELLLLGVLGLLVLMQVMFVGLIKNKRPTGL